MGKRREVEAERPGSQARRYRGAAAGGLALLVALAVCAPSKGADAIPWGAMYTPAKSMGSKGMTGTVAYYRGPGGARRIWRDLAAARRKRTKVILTLGSVNPSVYADARGHIDMAKVRREIGPFAAVAGRLKPYIADGTVWGIRFMDEPHDPSGLPRGVTVNPKELGEVMAYLKKTFGKVRVGATSPARYMVKVPNADFAFGQYNHDNTGRRFPDGVAYIRRDAALAAKHGMSYVASINANRNSVDNRTFFKLYLDLAKLKDVHFMTSWQWPQGRHPRPSFEKRLNDPRVQDLVRALPQACRRDSAETASPRAER